MTNKIKLFLISIAAILVLAGCDNGSSYNPEDEEGAEYVLAGYYMMAGEESAISEGTSRAAAPTWWDDYKDYTYADVIAMGIDGLKIVNYPEQGQKTYITMTEASATYDVYKISSRTEYPKRDSIEYYIEEYYLQRDPFQSEPDKWSTGIIVSKTESDWVELTTTEIRDESKKPKVRETMEVHFDDGSVRYEWITDVHPDSGGTARYAHFDLDGDMTVPTDEDWAPVAGGDSITWSSKVNYYQSVKADIGWFTTTNKEIFGARYYTEDSDLSSSVAYETILGKTTVNSTGLDWVDNIANWLFGRGDGNDKVLAETVIRYQLTGNNNKRSTVVRSYVYTWFGRTYTLDYELEY